MQKYLASYQVWKNDEWQPYIEEVSLVEMIYLLEKVVNDSIDELHISFKSLQPATKIDKPTAKALLAILSEEQSNVFQKTFDEFYGEREN